MFETAGKKLRIAQRFSLFLPAIHTNASDSDQEVARFKILAVVFLDARHQAEDSFNIVLLRRNIWYEGMIQHLWEAE